MPTFFGATSVPVDGAAATNATTTITLTPPTSMLDGDLVIVYLTQRGTATFSVGVTGGQTWTSIGRNVGTTNVALETYWARYNGTWAANPRFDFSAGTNTTAVMIVFRPDTSTNVWGTEQIATTAAAAAATITVTGITPANPNNVTVANWNTADDNTWGTLTGTNWTKGTLSAQYRNTAGTDASSTFAYQLQSTAAATNNVSQTQLTLGNDATTWRRVTWYEYQQQTVDKFELWNATTNVFVRDLINNDTISIGTDVPTLSAVAIRARTTPDDTVGSVRLDLSGSSTQGRTENTAPYFLYGDNAGDPDPWLGNAGTHSLTATAWSASGASGIQGSSLTISFNIDTGFTPVDPFGMQGFFGL